MLLLQNNDFTKTLKNQEKRLKALNYTIVISAHWLSEEPSISIDPNPIIYDFYGFPDELYKIKYEAFSDKKILDFISKELNLKQVQRGLDHGAWVPLYHMLFDADMPVFQISIPINRDFDFYVDFGKKLSSLKNDANLIFSGGVIHNLMKIRDNTEDWAYEFSDFLKRAVLSKDIKSLKNAPYHRYGPMAHPTWEHFIPLLYFVGASERPTILYDGFEMGNLSLLSFCSG